VKLKKFIRSPQEIGFRLRQEAMNYVLATRPPGGKFSASSPLAGLPDPGLVIERLRGSDFARQVETIADEVMAHRFPLLGFKVETGPEIAWRRDYQRGIETGKDYFRRIPYLDVSQVGDHKVIWELNRHQHFVVLAQAYRFTGRQKYLDQIRAQWESWVRENPFQHGINWCSALEVAFRALSWIWTYHLVGGDERFLVELARHGWHLEYNLSYYFSPNTHLLGEAVALHALGVLFPAFPRAERWRELGHQVVTRELERQVLADGAHFEQSTYYHVYALDFFLLHYLLAGRPASYVPVLQKMAEYLDAILGPARSIPLIGDDDGGRLFHPYGVHTEYGRATMSVAGLLLDRPDWVGPDDTLAAWWLGATPQPVTPRQPPATRLFSESGTVVFERGDRFIVFNAGGFGPYQAGHSHSDSLSIFVRQGGEELLIDPGTFEYVGEERNRFRGSAAHNTLRIDGLDQADPAGSFGWLGRPEVEIVRHSHDEIEAVCHYRGFTHRRQLVYGDDELRIIDEIDGPTGAHQVEQFWHAGEAIERLDPVSFRIGSRSVLILGEGSEITTETGWRSTAYGRKEPAAIVTVRRQGSLPLRMMATLRF